MWIGWLEFDLLLGDVHSLKQKRSALRPLISELARRFPVSAAETAAQDLHRSSTSRQVRLTQRLPPHSGHSAVGLVVVFMMTPFAEFKACRLTSLTGSVK